MTDHTPHPPGSPQDSRPTVPATADGAGRLSGKEMSEVLHETFEQHPELTVQAFDQVIGESAAEITALRRQIDALRAALATAERERDGAWDSRRIWEDLANRTAEQLEQVESQLAAERERNAPLRQQIKAAQDRADRAKSQIHALNRIIGQASVWVLGNRTDELVASVNSIIEHVAKYGIDPERINQFRISIHERFKIGLLIERMQQAEAQLATAERERNQLAEIDAFVRGRIGDPRLADVPLKLLLEGVLVQRAGLLEQCAASESRARALREALVTVEDIDTSRHLVWFKCLECHQTGMSRDEVKHEPDCLLVTTPPAIVGKSELSAIFGQLDRMHSEIMDPENMRGNSTVQRERVFRLGDFLIPRWPQIRTALTRAEQERDEARGTVAYLREGASHTEAALAASESRVRALREALPDPGRLDLLAAWFDAKHPSEDRAFSDVQYDLRSWAQRIRGALAVADDGPGAAPSGESAPQWAIDFVNERPELRANRCRHTGCQGPPICSCCNSMLGPDLPDDMLDDPAPAQGSDQEGA